jgi:hypothetical protein
MHIHEWARVISTEMGGAEMYTNSSSGSYYLWVKWPESFSQKKLNIDHTFNAANATKGGTSSNTLFINSLCGYYATDKLQNTFVAGNYKTSILPYADHYEVRTGLWSTRDLSCNHAGNGGDIAGLAADLNVYFWNKMKNVDGTTEQGPLGFVMMNYIASSVDDFKNSPLVGTGNHVSAQDAEKASEELPNMILMNNFKFPLAQAPADPDITTSGTVTVSDFDNIYLNGGKAISFE